MMGQSKIDNSALTPASRVPERSAPITNVAVIVLSAALIWLAGLAGVEETPESVGSSLSQGPRGALALYRWLERSGFQVSRVEAGPEVPRCPSRSPFSAARPCPT